MARPKQVFTADQVTADILAVAEDLGHTPSRTEFINSDKRTVTITAITEHGGFKTLRADAGLEAPKRNRKRKVFTEAQVLKDIRACAKAIGHSPRGAEFRKWDGRTVTMASVAEHFGTYNAARAKAGMATPSRLPSPEQLVEDVRNVAVALGVSPTVGEYAASELRQYPISAANEVFGGYNDLKKAAALPVVGRGRPKKDAVRDALPAELPAVKVGLINRAKTNMKKKAAAQVEAALAKTA